MSTPYPARFQIGETVNIYFDRGQSGLRGYVKRIIFTKSKVRYSVFLKEPGITLENLDSVLLDEVPESEHEVIDMPDDNGI